LGHFKVVLTDFERTLVRLFQDSDVEKKFFNEVWSLCRRFDIPTRVLNAAGESPYSLWTKAYHWMTWSRRNPLHAEWMYHAATSIATKYEKHAAESVRLFDDVRPVLEQLRTADIPVVIVSNNATEAVQWILEKNDADRLVTDIVGREFKHEFVGNLKPKPLLLLKALELSGCGADTALLVGDSVDDMKAGRRAKIRRRVGLLQHSTASRWQLRRAGAHLVLNRFGDLQDLLPSGDR
jgi:HAD superfamily hydrolase (TIGR01549 family)